MLLSVTHVTRYRYGRAVRGVVQSLRLTPATFDGQRVLHWAVSVDGGVKGGIFRDGAGDMVCGWTVPGPVDEITVRAGGTVETTDTAGVLRGHREVAPPLAWLLQTPVTVADAALTELARAAVQADGPLAVAHAMAAAVGEAIEWTPGATGPATTAAQALEAGQGVCQDHAHALIAMARAVEMPARYVSGYLAAGDDTSPAAHAWAELWIDGLGWVGFDPANHCCPDARYVRLGAGLDAQDAAPIRGVARGGLHAEELDVTVQVQPAQVQSQTQQ